MQQGSRSTYKGTPIQLYGCVVRLDYKDPNSLNLIRLVDCSKGVRTMYVSEDRLVKESYGP